MSLLILPEAERLTGGLLRSQDAEDNEQRHGEEDSNDALACRRPEFSC